MRTLSSSKEVERERKQQYWGDHLHTWRKSGLTQAEYCRRNQLSTKSFTYWKSKTRRVDRSACGSPAPADPPMKFVPVPVRPMAAGPGSAKLVVVFQDRYRVEVADGFNPATFEKVVQVLARL